ncbi:MAG TPA: DNA-3-methyladenine glycosylase 2 family protein [Candidatus Limnocylindria bacterium]|nr:DNA-3-methyladenine glycosylase 2 family protein [Candidatus Limnocylindria bacterium]
MSAPQAVARLAVAPDNDLGLTVGPLWQGPGDPTLRFETGRLLRATRTAAGAAALAIERVDSRHVEARAWGAGAEAVLAGLGELLGEADRPELFEPRHGLIAELLRRRPVRMPRSRAVFEALLPAIIAQKVTSFEARRSYRVLIGRYGERAPGPLGLRLQPAPEVLAGLPYHAYHEFGIERRRADTIRSAAAVADSLERLVELPAAEAAAGLMSLAGIGQWTAAETVRPALGDPDTVSIGDYNLPHLVCWALAGERRGDDARMLELLEPYRGQRARAIRLLVVAGRWPPRRGPRLAARQIARL